MSLEKFARYMDILVDLYGDRLITIMDYVKKYEMPYSSVITLFRRWVKEGYLKKIEIEEKKPGGAQYTYHLTPQGKTYVRSFFHKVNLPLPPESGKAGVKDESTSERVPLSEDLLNDFVLELPEILLDLDIDLQKEQYNSLLEKVRAFFRKKI